MPLVRWISRLVSPELRLAVHNSLKVELKSELRNELVLMIDDAMRRQSGFRSNVDLFQQHLSEVCRHSDSEESRSKDLDRLSAEWRILVRESAGLSSLVPQPPSLPDMFQEFSFLQLHREVVAPVFKSLAKKRVLFAGQAYYNAWYLSRALRNLGWKADVLNWDQNPASSIYYHGEDYSFDGQSPLLSEHMLEFYLSSIYAYDVFHFSNMNGINFGFPVQSTIENQFSKYAEIYLLKALGKKVVYSHGGCQDGVSQTAFSKWGPESVCSICIWRNEPSVCSDERNLAWGEFRNSVADYQCLLGGNRADFNDDSRVHEVPEFYCLDRELWHPQIEIPEKFILPAKPEGTIWLYHAVGNKADRTDEEGINIKSSHVYLPLIESLKNEGYLLELLEPVDVPNVEVRFIQAQADIFLDMLTYGWFGANVREALMLAKPVVCYIRPEWLEDLRREIPDYAAELPIISATPDTVEAVLKDLIANPEKRYEIGQKGRQFALKWHSAEAGGRRFDEIYTKLLQGDPLLRSL